MKTELTAHQTAILLCFAEKGGIPEAAEALNIKVPTFKNQLMTIYRKLGANSGVNAVYIWMINCPPHVSKKWETYDSRVKRRRDSLSKVSGE